MLGFPRPGVLYGASDARAPAGGRRFTVRPASNPYSSGRTWAPLMASTTAHGPNEEIGEREIAARGTRVSLPSVKMYAEINHPRLERR